MSSPCLTILSSATPFKADFDGLMLSLGGRVHSQDETLHGAIDVAGKWTAEGSWIIFEQPSPAIERMEIEALMEELKNDVERKLGGLPKTLITIVTYRSEDWDDWPGIRAVGAGMILGFMRIWPSVCFDDDGQLYDLAEFAAYAARLSSDCPS